MTRTDSRLKLIAVLAALLILAGLTPRSGSAQDADPTPAAGVIETVAEVLAPVAAAVELPPVEESAPPAVEASPPPAEPVPSESPAPSESPVASPAPSDPPAEDPAPTDPTTAPGDVATPVNEPAPSPSPEASAAPSPKPSDDPESTSGISTAEESEAVTVSVSVVAFNCPGAPSSSVPGVIPPECTPAAGVKFEALVGDVSLGTFTTGADGIAQVSALDGETLSVAEILSSVTPGYAVVGSGSGEVLVAEGAALSLPHAATTEDPIPGDEVGRLQLTQGECPTLGEARTELRYIAPQTLQAQAEDGSGCHGVGGAEFLVETNEVEAVSAAAVEGLKRTDGDGNWRGELPVGSYTVTDVSSGQSLVVEVVLDGVTGVVAIDYVEQVAGSIGVRRFVCAGDDDTTEISVTGSEPVPGAGCAPQDGTFQLNDGTPFTGGGDGAVTFEVPIGTYQFSALSDGGGTEIQIAEGATTWVLVERFATVGDISVAYNRCDDPASLAGDPNDPFFWAAACNNPISGAQLALINAAGEPVSTAITDASGFATWTDIAQGSYSIQDWSADATCAVFVGQQAALGGFQIAPGRTVEAQVFGCLKAAVGPGGGNPGGGGGGSGGGETAAPGPAADDQVVVTRLPSTGSSTTSANAGMFNPVMIVTAGLAMIMLLASGVVVYGRRRA